MGLTESIPVSKLVYILEVRTDKVTSVVGYYTDFEVAKAHFHNYLVLYETMGEELEVEITLTKITANVEKPKKENVEHYIIRKF